MTRERVALIEDRLNAAFSPEYLQVKDQSHLHAGHSGAADGRGHFDVTIVAEAFEKCGAVQGHQLIYAALGELMNSDIHALSINVKSTIGDISK